MELNPEDAQELARQLVTKIYPAFSIYKVGPPDADGQRTIWFYHNRGGHIRNLTAVARFDASGAAILLTEPSEVTEGL